MKPVKKAVIVAAGLGTRFLPITKTFPKEMLPLIDKPVLQYIIEEVVASGIKEIIIVISPEKDLIKKYFTSYKKLEYFLKNRGKKDLLKEIQKINKLAKFHFCYQKKPIGIADAILKAEQKIKNEPFALLFADDVVASEKPCLKQLIDVYQKTGASVVAVETVPWQEVFHYGVIKKGKKIAPRCYQLDNLVEKPALKDAPSNLAIVGRYVLVPPILKSIRKLYQKSLKPGEEIYLTDALKTMLDWQEKIYACQYQGKWLSCGSKAGWLAANLAVAKNHPEVKKEFKNILKNA